MFNMNLILHTNPHHLNAGSLHITSYVTSLKPT